MADGVMGSWLTGDGVMARDVMETGILHDLIAYLLGKMLYFP